MARVTFNKQEIVIKFLFLITYAALASWLSYFYIYLKEVPGLSSLQIGIVAGFQQFNTVFVVPVWGLLSDKFGRKRMLLSSVGLSILLIPGFLIWDGALGFTLYMVLLTLFYNPIISILDTIALDYEEQSNGKTSFGQIRLFASIGWATSSLLTGIFIDQDHLKYIFIIAPSLLLVMWSTLLLFYKPLKVTRNLNSLKPIVIKHLLKAERKLFWFLGLVFLYSLFSAPVYLIINVYYHEIGAPNSIIGLAFAVQAISELPFFFYGKKLVMRFGASRIFLFTMLATAIRMVAYGLNSRPEIAVGIGVIHGISIGLFFVSIVAFVHNIVPPHLRSTGQSLIHTFYAGGVAFGNILTGVLNDFISVRMTMLLNAGAIMLLIVVVLIINKKSKVTD
jgi:PPP family 3-phenylpropionic acid transporter